MNILNTLSEAITGQPEKHAPTLLYEFVIAGSPAGAATKTESRAFAAAKQKWLKGYQGTCLFTQHGAGRRYQAQFGTGADHTLEATRTRGLESFVSENAAKMAANKALMGEGSQDAANVINAVHARLAPAVAKVLAARESAERTEATTYGLVPIPSALTTAIRQFSNSLTGLRVGGKPDDQAAFNF